MPYRLRAYAPDGAALGPLPNPLEFRPMVAHNDVGSLAVTYTSVAAGGQHLATALGAGLEVAVEAWLGPGPDDWTEPKGCRFVRISDGDDPADQTRSVSLEMPSYAWLLSKATNYATTGLNAAGDRVFVAPTVGSLLLTLLNENAARGGVCQAINPTFTATHDSAGAPWPTLPDQTYPLTLDYLSILDDLTAKGALDWTTQARGLYAYLPDSATLSPDLSGDGGVVLQLGVDVSSAPNKRTIENLAGRMYVRTEAGGVATATEPAAPAPWGVFEAALQVGSVADESAAVAAGEAELERVGKVRGQYTRDLVLTPRSQRPLVDYWPGAWITAPGASAAGEKLRVQQTTLTVRGVDVTGSATLNDLLLESDERRARTLASLAGGGIIAPGGPPAPTAVDPEASRVPTTPTGLQALAELYFDAGTPRGRVTTSWDAVTTATDGGTLAIAGYELQWRLGDGAWQTIPTPELAAELPPLTPGDEVGTRVRTVGARTTLPSAWSTVEPVTVPGDVTAPPVPTVPDVDGAMTVISVTWDGLLTGVIPADFAKVEVAVGPTATPTTVRGTLTGPGTVQIDGETIDETRYVRTRSVDTSDNRSDWTTAVPVVVQSVVADEIDQTIIEAIDQALTGPVDGTRLTPWTVLPNRVLIGPGDNMHPDPGMQQPTAWENPDWIQDGQGKDNARALVIPASAAQTGSYFGAGAPATYAVRVTGGQQLQTYAWVYSPVALAANVARVWVRTVRMDTGATVSSIATPSPAIPANTWTRITGSVTVPAGVDNVGVLFGLYKTGTTSDAVRMCMPDVRARTTAELVVDGSITAVKLAADSVTAGAIAAGAIDGKLITGAVIRTDAGGDRLELSGTSFKAYVGGNLGLQLDPNALVAYNSTGALKFRLSAYTGAGTMTFVDFLQGLNIKTDGIELYDGSDSTGTGVSVGYIVPQDLDNLFLLYSNTRNIEVRTTNNDISLRAQNTDFYADSTRRLALTAAGSVGLDNLLTATTATANIGLGAPVGTLYPLRRITSSLTYKQDVEDHEIDVDAWLSIRPRSWRAKDEVRENPDTTRRHVGFIAEEVAAAGFHEFVQLLNGQPDGLTYERMTAGQQAVLINHAARIAALERALENA